MRTARNIKHSAKLTASLDGNVEPTGNEVAVYWADADCTDLYEMPSDQRHAFAFSFNEQRDLGATTVTYN